MHEIEPNIIICHASLVPASFYFVISLVTPTRHSKHSTPDFIAVTLSQLARIIKPRLNCALAHTARRNSDLRGKNLHDSPRWWLAPCISAWSPRLILTSSAESGTPYY